MKKLVLCKCGSGKAVDECCSSMESRVSFKPFTNPNDHKGFLRKIMICEQFGLKIQGLFEFYGDDLIAYKLANPNSKRRNEFLEILSLYFTVFLENDCPKSWKECDAEFWEEFIFAFYPLHIKVTPRGKEVEQFQLELKKFIRWLDRRIGSSSYQLVETYLAESGIELKKCEQLINRFYLHTFPGIHHDNWDFNKEFFLNSQQLEECKEAEITIFEIKNVNGSIVVATSLNTNITYYIKNMPVEILTQGMLISGTIGRKNGDRLWLWNQPESVFPPRGRRFLEDIRLH